MNRAVPSSLTHAQTPQEIPPFQREGQCVTSKTLPRMNNTPSPDSVVSMTDEPAERRKRIRRLVILILLISVGLHVVAGLGAGVWVVARYLAQPKAQFVVQKQVQMTAEDREHQMKMEETTSLRPKPTFNNRIQSLRPSKLALPTLPRVPLETITPIDTDALISDQVDGMGRYGQGSGADTGGFFGGAGASGSGLLAGGLYDLKKDTRGTATVMAEKGPPGQINSAAQNAYLDIINRLSRTGSTDPILRRFYRAPDTLYMPKLAIPVIKADEAPKAFNVADKVEPSYWVAIYRGRVKAPDSGNYKFVGFADDILLVKVNGRLVFDGSLLGATRLHRKEGISFSVEKGQSYDIELILGECPGGYFSAWLQIQKQGAGEKPYWFRMNDQAVKFDGGTGDGTQTLPTDKMNGPIWWPATMSQPQTGTGL